jgi:hypothetical protein
VINLKDPNKRLVVISLAVTAVVLGLGGWLIWTDWKEVERLREEHETLRTQISRDDARLRTVGELEERVLVLREQVKDHAAILPDDAEIHAFVDKLTEFAAQSGVSITGLDDTQAKQRKTRAAASREAFDRVTYKLRLVAGTASFVKFLDLFENKYERFVNVPALRIKAGDSDPRKVKQVAAIRHEIDMDLETYVYNPKGRIGEMVEIPKEAEKLERLRQSGRLTGERSDLQLARYTLRDFASRRDPFVDPRLSLAINSRSSEEARRVQLAKLDDVKAQFAILGADVDAERGLVDPVHRIQVQEANSARIREFDALVSRLETEGFFTVDEYLQEFQEVVLIPFRAIQALRGDTHVEISLVDLETRVAGMEQALSEQAYDRVLTIHEEIQRLKGRLAAGSDATEVLGRAEAARRKAGVYLDFATKKFDFGGCIVSDDDPSRSVIIINGRSYSPGETVEEGLVITSIRRHDVGFDFRGVTVEKSHSDR